MAPESMFTRWRNAMRPLSQKTYSKAELAQRRKQKRLGWGTAAVIVAGAAGYSVYDYIASAPQRAQAMLDEGMRLMGPGKYGDAIAKFNRAIDISPQFAEAYLDRGIAEHNLGRTDSALTDLDQAAGLNPNLTRAIDERGAIFQEKGDVAKAIDEYSKSIKIQPTTEGFYKRALAYEKLGDHAKALPDFDLAIVQMRDAPYAYRARALAKDALGDEDGAKADREYAHTIDGR